MQRTRHSGTRKLRTFLKAQTHMTRPRCFQEADRKSAADDELDHHPVNLAWLHRYAAADAATRDLIVANILDDFNAVLQGRGPKGPGD